MTDEKKLLLGWADALDNKERELIEQKRAVRAFLRTKHNEKATRKYVEALEKTEEGMEAIMASLLELKAETQFRKTAERLCKRCEGLDRYTAYMNKVLYEDLARKKKTKIDWVKNTTFLFAIPLSFFMVVKNGLFHNHTTPEQAAGIGLVVSSSVLAAERITSGFRATGIFLCKRARNTGTAIKNVCVVVTASLCSHKKGIEQKAQRLLNRARKKTREFWGKPEV